MESSIKTQKVTTLILTEAEAKWLRLVMQNSLSNNETTEDTKMRQTFWNSLKEETHAAV